MKEDKNIKMPASDTDNIPADTEALEDSWIKGAPRQTKYSNLLSVLSYWIPFFWRTAVL